DRPAPTLTCRCTDVYCGRFVHPAQDRGLTLREAAALQSFRHDYEFHAASMFFAAQQVGNAVPVALARRLGATIAAAASLEPRDGSGTAKRD
ncbi:MAG TPA: DNA cytosine methyltransferase, partial [Vicinamibacterales bacterium]